MRMTLTSGICLIPFAILAPSYSKGQYRTKGSRSGSLGHAGTYARACC
jgi:hypothetical protein